MKKVVLSSSEFDSKKQAEATVNKWWQNDKLKTKRVKMYEVVEVYDLELKFVKQKG